MDGFQMNLKRSGIRKRRRAHFATAQVSEQKKPSAFDAEDDSGDEKPRRQAISQIVVAPPPANPTTHTKQVSETPADSNGVRKESSNEGERLSQIARLVKRRKTAESTMVVEPTSLPARDEAMFRYDVEKCPDQASLSAYRQTPIDGFGATMLKAMGWKGQDGLTKDGDSKLYKHLDRKARPSRLGLGAKLDIAPAKDPSRKTYQSGSQAQEENGASLFNGDQTNESASEDDNSDNVLQSRRGRSSA